MFMNIFCCHGNGWLHVCARLKDSYGLECVIIASGHFTNMQGCHGNCNGGLHWCTEKEQVYHKYNLKVSHFYWLVT